MPPDAGVLFSQRHPIWDSRRRWSLWDMINFVLHNFVFAHDSLRQLLNDTSEKAASEPLGEVSAVDHRRVASVVQVVADQCVEALYLRDAWDTIQELFGILGNQRMQPYTWGRVHSLLETLQRQISLQLQGEYFFHYMREDAHLLIEMEKEWGIVISSFPTVKPEVASGIDCFSIGHNTACVFHMMRAAEFGLRMIARERGIKIVGRNKPIEWGTWTDVFRAIDDKLRAVRNATPGPKKDAALAFYNGALSDLRVLQSNYRDPTMHFRDSYDRGQAYSAMFRVKTLMANLASKLREDRIRKIKWGL